jgi:hypothetical protein
MARKRRTKAWWQAAVVRWRRSGRTAAEFAVREGLSVNTLRWWSSRLGHDTRAEHGSPAMKPIEIAVPEGGVRSGGDVFEISVGDAVVRCDVGTDVAYVASLVRTLRGS